MSSFWSTSDGEDVTENVEKEFDAGGGGFELIPDKTNCLMLINSAGWKDDRDGNRYINIRWDVVKPEAYAKRVVFHKLWVGDDDPRAKDPAKKRDKALKMLATIDANAGGKLAKAGREPSDDDLALALTNKQMICKVMVWEQNGSEGNWISAVAPAKGGNMAVSEVVSRDRGGGSSGAGKRRDPVDDDLDGDEIPF